MLRKDATSGNNSVNWTSRVLGLLAIAVTVAVGYGMSQFGGPTDATAQAPGRQLPQRRTTQRTAPQGQPQAGASGGAVGRVAGPPVDTVAIVNNERITRGQLAHECLIRFGAEVLESLVNRQVIEQACRARGVEVLEADVHEEIIRIAKRFGVDVNSYLKMLQEKREITVEQYKREMIWPTLALRRLAAKKIAVTDDEMRKAIETEYGPKVRARLISVASKEKAQQVWRLAKQNPESFGQLAKEHSEDPNSASARGVIPPIRLHVGDKRVEEAVFALEEGQITDILFTANQYIILKCDQRVPERYLTPEQLAAVKDRARSVIRDSKLKQEAAKIFEELQKDAQVVKIFGDPQLERQHPGHAAHIDNKPLLISQLGEECLVRHGKSVLEGEINRHLLLQALRQKGIAVNQQDIDYEIARAADSFGYVTDDGKPDVQKWINDVTNGDRSQIDLYIRDAVWPSVALKKLVGGRVKVTEDDLRKGFESNYGPRVEALAIVVGSQREAQKVWQMARDNPTDEFFGQLANQYSIEPTSKANYGRVPPIRRFSGQEHLEKEAFRLEPGELSGLIAVDDRFIILRSLGQTKPMVDGVDDVRAELQRDMLEKKLRLAMAEEFDRLTKNAKVDNRLARPSRATVAPASANLPLRRPATNRR
ncbi:MAG: peptidylprolyl isomerase [Pirellulaceae bacterium]|jgi:parvulin-like peptidyl-prolyl isomerase|nr:peptidylprolyl isomerase [Pirellulaceae bacterium]